MKIQRGVVAMAAWVAMTACGGGSLTPPPLNSPPPEMTVVAIEVSITPAPIAPTGELATASGPATFPTLIPITAANAAQIAEVAHLDAPGVRAVSISPTGKTLAAAEDTDNRIVLYDMPYTFGVIVLAGHQGKVNDLTWSPDGRIVASASDDGTARLWDALTGQETSRIAIDQDGVAAVAWSPDGTKIVTGNRHGTAQVWDAQSGDELLRVQPGADFSTAVALVWSPDSRQFAAATWLGFENAGEVKVYDAASGEQTGGLGDAFAPAPGSLAWATFQPKIAWIRDSDGRAIIWDIPNSPEAVALAGEQKATAVGFSADSTMIVSAGYDHTARIWEAATGALLATLQGHADTIHTARWSNDMQYLVTAGWDGVIRVWGVAER